MAWLVLILLVFIFQIATILILEFRHPTKTIAWLMILFIVPFIGFVMYYFLATEYRQRRKVRHKGSRMAEVTRSHIINSCKIINNPGEFSNEQMHHEDRLFGLLKNLMDCPITQCNEMIVYNNAKDTYDAILESMEQAKDHIHLEYYIFKADQIGCRFQEVLIRKAREGIKVRFIYDGLGSYELANGFLQELKDAGVEVHSFLPLLVAFFNKRMNYRNHRKIVVVDGIIGFLGGMNVGDEHLGSNPKLGYWRDTHMRMLGDAVNFLQHTFLIDWFFVSGEKLIEDHRYFPVHQCPGNEQVQLISSGPDTQGEGILEMYFAAITTATSHIYITSPYFIPDQSIMMALKTAAVSGLDVRIIIPGVADSKIVELASLSYLEELMRAGVKFYQYEKGFIHAKVMIIDYKLATVGTANLDMRSFFSNFELNAVMFDRKTIQRIESDFLQDLLDSREVTMAKFMQRSRYQKAREVLARLFSPLL
ncbi:MAG TPA: cardiolipin synthase [Bacilli bacterium]